jgi:hypothetical protein
MTDTATPMHAETPKQKTRSNRGAGHGSQRRLVDPLYLGLDAASVRIASAASSVISFPLSRLWIVIRDTPSRAATCVGVPMDLRIVLYSLAVILNLNGDVIDLANFVLWCISVDLVNGGGISGFMGAMAGAFMGALFRGPCINGAVDVGNVRALELGGLDSGNELGECWSGHCRVWFGVGRSQRRRGERKIFLRSLQELSVKSFYAPFIRLNA